MASVTTLIPAFGGNRTNADNPGWILGKCDWIGVPFAGGMPEVPGLKARTIVVNDLHRHIINCARACRDYAPGMIEYLEMTLFHPESLAAAQEYCKKFNLPAFVPDEDIAAEVSGFNGCHFGAAVNYFISQWMGRSGVGSTDKEFEGNISTRWTASGGDSNTRFRSATNAIADFAKEFRRCNFTCLDAFEFIDSVKDNDSVGLYLDPPWPDLGGSYRHKFSDADQKRLADRLSVFDQTKIVLRFGDHPLIRSLYREESGWEWREATGRTQGNSKQQEVYISKRCE
jgi:site-specific DNA-adenine methylase